MLLLAFLIGFISGLRSLTAPAVVAFAAYRNWLNLNGTSLSFLGSIVAVVIFALLAILELLADQLPSTPSRTKPPGLIARILFGALSGAAVGLAGAQSIVVAGCLGIVGALAGTFGGYQARTRLVRTLRVPDFVIASLEDAVAIGGAFIIVSRF